MRMRLAPGVRAKELDPNFGHYWPKINVTQDLDRGWQHVHLLSVDSDSCGCEQPATFSHAPSMPLEQWRFLPCRQFRCWLFCMHNCWWIGCMPSISSGHTQTVNNGLKDIAFSRVWALVHGPCKGSYGSSTQCKHLDGLGSVRCRDSYPCISTWYSHIPSGGSDNTLWTKSYINNLTCCSNMSFSFKMFSLLNRGEDGSLYLAPVTALKALVWAISSFPMIFLHITSPQSYSINISA